jgi:hypothetical protein
MNATIRQDTNTAVLIKISRTDFCSIESKSGSSFLALFLAQLLLKAIDSSPQLIQFALTG